MPEPAPDKPREDDAGRHCRCREPRWSLASTRCYICGLTEHPDQVAERQERAFAVGDASAA